MRQESKIAIVMGVHNPNISFFIAQIESLKSQTLTNWTCYISDDGSTNEWLTEVQSLLDQRFIVKTWDDNVGSYRNFERGIGLIRSEDYIFFADQDDIWGGQKLEKVLNAFAPEVALVHSNADIFYSNNPQLIFSLHEFEKTKTTNLTTQSLLLKNSVTGCTMAIRRSVLNLAMPFPNVGGIQHDLWLAMTSLRLGKVKYVSESLVKYRQHENNAIGARRVKFFREFLAPRNAAVAYLVKNDLRKAFQIRFGDNPQIPIMRLLLDQSISIYEKLYRLNYLFGSVLVFVHDIPFEIRIVIFRLRTHIWIRVKRSMHLAKRISKLIIKIVIRRDFREKLIRYIREIELMNHHSRKKTTRAISYEPSQTEALSFNIRASQTSRFIVFLPSLKKEAIFGGLATAIRLSCFLGRQFEVQLCITDTHETNLDDKSVNELVASLNLDGNVFRKMLQNVEYQHVTFSKNDYFLTTAWWTTYKASEILKASSQKSIPLYYLVQDFEPIFYPASDLYAAALETYSMADYLVVNSESLSRFLSQELGFQTKDRLVFTPTFLDAKLEAREFPKDKIGPYRIVIYGRPFTQRNLFATLIRSLDRALVHFAEMSFEILSLGESHDDIELMSGHVVKSLGKKEISDYLQILSTSDLGVSLMLSPHPSYPPLEMASSGMQVITNDYFGYKKNLEELYPNIHVVEPNSNAIARKIIDVISGRTINPERIVKVSNKRNNTLEDVAMEITNDLRINASKPIS